MAAFQRFVVAAAVVLASVQSADPPASPCWTRCGDTLQHGGRNRLWSDCLYQCHGETSTLSTEIGLGLVILSTLSFGCAAWATCRVLEIPKPVAALSGLMASIAVLAIGLLPASTRYPLYCAEVCWKDEAGLQVYPIAFLGAGGSFYGLAVAIAWLLAKPCHRLGKAAVIYLSTVSICNLCGVIGVLHMSCHAETYTGLPFYAAWLVSSFATNLGLQRIVVMKAALIDKSHQPHALKLIFRAEMAIAALLFSGTVFMAVAASTEIFKGGDADPPQVGNGIGWRTLHIVAWLMACVSALFVVFDLMFSCKAAMAMYSGMEQMRQQMSKGQIAPPPGEDNGFLDWPGRVAHVFLLAKINLMLVVMSVTTTTIYYVSFVTITISITQEVDKDVYYARVGFLFMAWLLDSLFNDACVTFVGFGPTADALATVGAVLGADIIGAPSTTEAIDSKDIELRM
eukprot:gnl/TRDRNA2_/TRDRNA2_87952_c0_seq1.p1 gnl/TRDRNA2_/TRDRNA2_87952_c0~~gnl/TRDRNA2_/TRDRNA2_87952_c0_seq1.p1  ORF type:complete len:462 (-),score=67.39 gnl/TRDRNA2_/TRDRNA2_87952_c0_seq1:21-1385(-)